MLGPCARLRRKEIAPQPAPVVDAPNSGDTGKHQSAMRPRRRRATRDTLESTGTCSFADCVSLSDPDVAAVATDAPEELSMANELLAELLGVFLRGRPAARSPTPCRMMSASQYDSGLMPPRSVPRGIRRAARYCELVSFRHLAPRVSGGSVSRCSWALQCSFSPAALALIRYAASRDGSVAFARAARYPAHGVGDQTMEPAPREFPSPFLVHPGGYQRST